jgi:MFS family permease
MSEAMTLSPAVHEPAGVRTPEKAALASWIGSAVEYYDLFIYGTAAALIFPRIFFSSSDPQTAAIAAFATFGVAYIACPFGAVALGHVGDRFGRRKVLIFTLLLMGISTFMIGMGTGRPERLGARGDLHLCYGDRRCDFRDDRT